MMMVYLIALIVGGALVGLSLLTGADSHLDGGAGLHASTGAEGSGPGGGDHPGPLDLLQGWLPLTSLRFWTFAAAFFGLTGTVLTMIGRWAAAPVAVAAVAVGTLTGVAVTVALRRLQRDGSDSSVGERDMVGATGRVIVPVAAGRTGKVRLHLKERTVDLLAETEEPVELAEGEAAMVVVVRGDGHVVVVRENRALAPAQPEVV